MTQVRSIQFHPADDPSYLSKIGNWVMTFLTDQNVAHTQLAMTNVVPRRIQNELQVRKFIIENTLHEHIWQIKTIECFDSSSDQLFELDLASQTAEHYIQQLLSELHRYDVDVTFIS